MKSNLTDYKEIRKFGAVGLVFFLAIAGIALWRDKPLGLFIFTSFASIMLPFLIFPRTMRPVYNGWLKVAKKIGQVMNAIILTLAFFIVIIPFAFLKRIFHIGGPPITISVEPDAQTYWRKRTVAAQPRKQFTRRY